MCTQNFLILINKYLSNNYFPISSEKKTQDKISKLISSINGLEREYRLDNKSIIDFFIPSCGLGIEVKVKGSVEQIYRQCERYCVYDELKSLLLVTARSMGFPKEINGKDCYYFSLSKAML